MSENQLAKTTTTAVSMLTDAEKRVVKAQFFPEGTTPEEMNYCMKVAESLNLNPILKQIWFIPRRSKNANNQWVNKVEPMAGRDSFLTLAHRSGQFAGIKSWVEIKECPVLTGEDWEMKRDLYAISEVKRKDSTEVFHVEVRYSEYVQKKSDGTPTKFWNEKKETMLKKVAESQVLRKAFNISGLYDESELEAPTRHVEVSVTDAPKMDAQRQIEAYGSAEKALLGCETVEGLEKTMKSFDREEIGPQWNRLDQLYMARVSDLSMALSEKKEKGIASKDADVNTPVGNDEDFGK